MRLTRRATDGPLRDTKPQARGFDELSGVTGMMVTVRVADSGLCGTVP